jgi:CHAT domain-containing protein
VTILPAPALRAPALWIGPLPGLIAVLALGCAASPPPVFAPQVAPAIASPAPARMKAKAAPLLALGAAVERDLPPGGRDEVSLDLDAGLYLRLGFDGRGAELSMSLSGPGGEVVASEEGDSEGRLAWITTTKGPYRLAVAAPKVKVAFRYQLLLLDQRPRVDPGDGQRLVADRALSAARQEKNAARALEQAQLALKLWRGLGDKDGEFEALDVIKAGDKENAAPWYTLALEQAQATGHLPHQARAQTDLGEALTRGNRLDEARAHLEAALPLWKALGDSYQQSRTLYYLGFGRASNGNLDEAIDFYHRSLALTDPAWDLTPDIRNALCNVYTASGASQRALDCFDQAFKLARDTGRTGTEAAVRTGRGLLHWRRGEARAALGEFGEALALNRSDPELAPYVGRVLVHIGSVELGLGQTEEALGNFQQAYGEFQRGGDDLWTASALVSIGRTELIMEQPEAALATFRKALKIASDNKGLRQEANALQGIGIALLQVHQGPQAIQSLQDALDIQAGIDRPGQALTEQKLGEAYGEGGDLVASRDALQKALQITEDVEAPYARSPILLDLARLERRQGNLPAALERIEGAIRILETVRSDLTDDRLRTSFFASKRSYYDFYVELLMELARRNPAGNYADRALAASEQGRARSLLDLLANSRSELTRGISSELRETEQDVRARLSQIQRQLADELSSHPPRPPVVKELENRRQETENEQQAVELRIKAESPLYAQIRYPSPLQRAEVQKLLRPDEALLEYSTGESETYLFVVTSEGLAVHTLKPTPEQLGDEVGIVRATLESGGRLTNAYRKTARRLYEDLVAPARAEIRGKRRLLIAPDGVLYHLAFEALLDREASAGAGHFLIEDWAVSYVPSASVLSSLSGQRPPAAAGSGAPLKQFIAFAPAYGPAATEDRTRSAGAATEPGSVPASTLPDLEGARQEVAAISRLYPDTELEVYLGAAASRENFKRSDLRTTALHFAGHGLLDEAHPERSSLEFADGPLRVDDIFNLELNANLVVLSACRTAGKVVTGEGLVGLTRAFLYAGAPSVIVTLWQAADTSARDLMVQFYRNLGLSGDKAEALRQAKLSIIEKGRTSGKLDRPYYWAPFILIGKPQ